MSGVKVHCPKHATEHIFKPTEVAQLVKYYMNQLVTVGFDQPLPFIENVSTPSALARAMCPQVDLDKIKAAHDSGFDGRKMPTLSKTWQETFLRRP